MRSVQACAAAVASLLVFCGLAQAGEEKQGGILRVYHRDSPASASIHEEATYSVNIPFMPVFNKRSSISSCGRASSGTTASRLRPPTSNAPSTC
jgi:hypothetical protein